MTGCLQQMLMDINMDKKLTVQYFVICTFIFYFMKLLVITQNEKIYIFKLILKIGNKVHLKETTNGFSYLSYFW